MIPGAAREILDLLISRCGVQVVGQNEVEEILVRHELARGFVNVKVGESTLSRDLVWCECGRGLSRRGFWFYCPRCGGKINQDSYREACEKALKADAMRGLMTDNERIEVIRDRLLETLKYMESTDDSMKARVFGAERIRKILHTGVD